MAGMSVEGRTSDIKEHTFQDVVQDVRVCVQIIMMKQSCFVWVGSPASSFVNLDVAMQTHMDSVPVCSTLMGGSGDTTGGGLAKRVAMKYKLQAFVSFNLPSTQPLLQAAVEKRVLDEIGKLV